MGRKINYRTSTILFVGAREGLSSNINKSVNHGGRASTSSRRAAARVPGATIIGSASGRTRRSRLSAVAVCRNTEARDSKCSVIDFSETGDFRISARVIHPPSVPRENAKEEGQRDSLALPYGRSCRATGMRVSCTKDAYIGCPILFRLT